MFYRQKLVVNQVMVFFPKTPHFFCEGALRPFKYLGYFSIRNAFWMIFPNLHEFLCVFTSSYCTEIFSFGSKDTFKTISMPSANRCKIFK
nr:MAG TPA: hypothetical protein [Caudoviricetes sp.]